MSEPDNFLSRWSRRKLDVEREKDALPSREKNPAAHPRRSESRDAENETPDSAALNSSVHRHQPRRDLDPSGEDSGKAGTKKPEFDLSTLPSLESITSGTDIRAFLQNGVPAELTRAALRRAWSADPAIRDFIGIAENQYDFATGADIPGFGSLDLPPEEIQKLVANVFGEIPQPPPAEVNTQAAAETVSAPSQPREGSDTLAESRHDAAGDEEAGQQAEDATSPSATSDTDAASQRNDAAQQIADTQHNHAAPPRRLHGRALPQ